MTDYLPKNATIEQACAWLEARTGETWILPRLMEFHLTPYFWNDYKPGYPAIYGDRKEGYQTHMIFQGDRTRLESDGGFALVTMYAAFDGSWVTPEPGWPLALSDLRFRREEVEEVAEIINAKKSAPAQNTATPAPMATEDAPEKQVDAMKKAALIAELEYEWSSIEADISDATRNGLKTAAHTGKHGEWDKDKARAWAVSKGKIKQAAPVHSLAAAWPGAVTRHTIGD